MNDLLNRLTSRKLWIAVGSIVVFVANERYAEALTVILAYLGIEGGADVASRLKPTNISTDNVTVLPAPSQDDFSAVDHSGKIISGRKIDETDEDWK